MSGTRRSEKTEVNLFGEPVAPLRMSRRQVREAVAGPTLGETLARWREAARRRKSAMCKPPPPSGRT